MIALDYGTARYPGAMYGDPLEIGPGEWVEFATCYGCGMTYNWYRVTTGQMEYWNEAVGLVSRRDVPNQDRWQEVLDEHMDCRGCDEDDCNGNIGPCADCEA